MVSIQPIKSTNSNVGSSKVYSGQSGAEVPSNTLKTHKVGQIEDFAKFQKSLEAIEKMIESGELKIFMPGL
ncbi:MAG: hypothetical protein SFT81_06555 [Candidatus Caenarcaniphilales bacterium]|nr:hypothetical protein [Candidatus Caenarcaniphilales bacterium]